MSSDQSFSSPENDPNLSDLGRAMLGGDSAASRPSSRPSAVWEPPTADELHKLLPQYEIVKMLGRGGMGAVYMGRQISLDRPVAIKILSATLGDADVGFSERFKNEARAMAKLNHPGIVSVYDFGETEGGLLYIVMEYVDGTDVARMIAANGRLHTEHAMAITAHVCDALSYAHERGIIHRDIKPANIMVGYDGSVKVADFGLAKVSTSNGSTMGLTQSGMAMGTLHFMAPEALVLGSSVDHRADIYAVGVMLYQMLTGKLPHGMFELPSIQVKGLDPRYDGIIARSMREDREVRYQSANELRRDLDAILTQPVVKVEAPSNAAPPQVGAAKLPTGARPKRPTGQPYRPQQGSNPPLSRPAPQKSHSGFWVAVTLLLAGGVGAWFFLQNRKGQTIDPTTVTPSESRLGCAVTLRTPDAARVLSLEKGQPRLYDSDPLRVIEQVDSLLKGWQFTSIPQRIDNEYEVSVSQSGTLIAFGGLHKGFTKEDVFGKDSPNWQADDQAIKGAMIKMCYRREVKAGEIIKMKAFELHLAASKIVIEKSAPSVAAIPPVTPPTVSPAPVPLPTAPMPSTSPPTPSTSTLEPKPAMGAGDWQPLFPSDTLAGWTGDVAGYRLANGILTSTDKGGDLISPKEYGSFHLKFDLRLTVGANNGIGVWCADNKGPYNFVGHTGFEIQLIDDNLPTYTKGDGWHLHGALSYFLTPKAKPMGLPGSWNSHELRIEGTHITLLINDKIVLDEELPRGDPVSGGSRRHRLDFSRQRGHLVFCGMKGPVEFRNVMIRDLDEEKKVVIQATGPTASPTLWVDAKNRTLQAKFVRLDGTNVFLEISGKVTPIALATLSASSQQIARQLQFSQTGENNATNWILGQWHQTNDGKDFPIFLLDFKADFSASFSGGSLRTTGRWKFENEAIDIDWSNGARYQIEVPSGKPSTELSGVIFGTDGQPGRKTLIRMQKVGVSSGVGWVPLFSEDSLSGWTGDPDSFRIAGGTLFSAGKGNLISPKTYRNFHLRFEVNLGGAANNGIGIWQKPVAGATSALERGGFEIQLQDDAASAYSKQKSYSRHGSIYGFIGADKQVTVAAGVWLVHEIRVEGARVTVLINGEQVLQADLNTLRQQVPGKPELDLRDMSGHIIFMSNISTAEFRNMQIKELP